MKVLVALKRVADPDNANKVKVSASGDAIDTTGLEWKTNPFDEYALEAALRLTENGKTPKKREGEVWWWSRSRRRRARPCCAPRSQPARIARFASRPTMPTWTAGSWRSP